MTVYVTVECPQCEGVGGYNKSGIDYVCPYCTGEGVVWVEEER